MMARRSQTVEVAFVLLAAGLLCRADKLGWCGASAVADGSCRQPEASGNVYEHPELSDIATLMQRKVSQGDGRGFGIAQGEDQEDVRDAAMIGANVGSERGLLIKRDMFSSQECTEKKWQSNRVCPWFNYNGHSKTGTAKKCAKFCETKSGTKNVGDIAPSFSKSVDAFFFSFNEKNGHCRCCFKNAKYVKDNAWDSWKCQADPVPCSLSDWSDWAPCSQTCGEGARSRSRSVTKEARYGGACGDLEESETCGAPCPIDCAMGEWSDWSACSVTCGDGTRSRSRTATTPAQHGGADCGTTEDSEACGTSPCTTTKEPCPEGTTADIFGNCNPDEEQPCDIFGNCNPDKEQPCPEDFPNRDAAGRCMACPEAEPDIFGNCRGALYPTTTTPEVTTTTKVPCPAGNDRDIFGNCVEPCPDGQQRFANGCHPIPSQVPCPAGKDRNIFGNCVEPCPEGHQKDVFGTCLGPQRPCGKTDRWSECDRRCSNGRQCQSETVCNRGGVVTRQIIC